MCCSRISIENGKRKDDLFAMKLGTREANLCETKNIKLQLLDISSLISSLNNFVPCS